MCTKGRPWVLVPNVVLVFCKSVYQGQTLGFGTKGGPWVCKSVYQGQTLGFGTKCGPWVL